VSGTTTIVRPQEVKAWIPALGEVGSSDAPELLRPPWRENLGYLGGCRNARRWRYKQLLVKYVLVDVGRY
jgi:hypothetical protein